MQRHFFFNYLDVAEVTSRAVTFVPLSRNELAANAFAFGAQSSSSVDVQTVTTGLQAVDNTADLDGTVDRTLLHHHLTSDVHTLDGDESTTGPFDPGGRPGSDTSESDDCNNNIVEIHKY